LQRTQISGVYIYIEVAITAKTYKNKKLTDQFNHDNLKGHANLCP